MKYSDFEKHIGKELGGAQEAVNMDQLLIDLNLGGKPKKRKIKPFLLWMLIPVLMIGIYSFFLSTNLDGPVSLLEEDTRSMSTVEQQSEKNIEGRNNIIDNTNNQNISKQNKESITKESKSKSENKSSEKLRSTKRNELLSHTNNSTQNTILHDNNQTSTINRYSQFRDGKNLEFDKSKVSTELGIDNARHFFPNEESDKSIKSVSDASTPTGNKEYAFYKSTEINANNKVDREVRSLIVTPSISKLAIDVTSLDIDNDELFSRMKINCPSFNQAHWRLALVPEIGYFTPFKTIESKTSDVSQGFNERKQYEETLEGINLGLYSMLVRDKLPFYLKAGISYSRITERTDLEYNYTVQDTSIGIISQTISANGDSITTIMGPVISETTFTGKNRQHNYIHLFDLPLSVGYNTYIGGFDVGIEVGVKFNLMTRATGNLLVSQSEYTNLALNEYFKKRIDLSYFGGVMIGRNFGRLGDFYLAPRFSYYPSDISNNTNRISQKYVTMGVNVGYVYKLR